MAGVVRQFTFLIDLDGESVDREIRPLTCTLGWSFAADQNSDGSVLSCGYLPLGSSTLITPIQESLLIGTVNAGVTIRTLRHDLIKDDGVAIRSEAITTRLDPNLPQGQVTGQKRFTHVGFPSTNPLEKGIDVQVAFDQENPHTDSTTWEDLVAGSGSSKATVKTGLGHWMHLRLLDQTGMNRGTVFNSFTLYYYDLFNQNREDD